jgi:hypothetical protein
VRGGGAGGSAGAGVARSRRRSGPVLPVPGPVLPVRPGLSCWCRPGRARPCRHGVLIHPGHRPAQRAQDDLGERRPGPGSAGHHRVDHLVGEVAQLGDLGILQDAPRTRRLGTVARDHVYDWQTPDRIPPHSAKSPTRARTTSPDRKRHRAGQARIRTVIMTTASRRRPTHPPTALAHSRRADCSARRATSSPQHEQDAHSRQGAKHPAVTLAARSPSVTITVQV